MTDEKIKALEFIESIIASMRESSFKCKEFCILICSAFLTVYATAASSPKLLVFLCAPVLVLFWLLDSYYLYKERVLRTEYKRIASSVFKEDDCSPLLFHTRVKGKGKSRIVLKAMFISVSTGFFYLPLLICSIIFSFVLLNGV